MNLIQSLSQHSDILIPTPDGAYTIKYQDCFVHSSRSPLKEAQKLISNVHSLPQMLIIAWGVGLGYHIEFLVQQGYKVIAIETRPQLAELFKKNFDVSLLVDFVEDPHTIFDVLVNLDSKDFQNFVDVSMMGFAIPTDVWQLKTQGVTALQSTHAIKKTLLPSWFLNIIQNISTTNVFYTFDPIFEGQNLVICSAGPSLKESLPHLKKHRNHLTIMAVDTALLSLVQYGIIPDYVHSVDAKIHNIADFRGIDSEIFNQITLVADISLSHQVLTLPWKEILLVSTSQPMNTKEGFKLSRHALQQYLWDNNIRFPETQTGGSVATSAFHLGIIYKAQRIYLVGQDLAYSQHRGHAVGSPYDMEYRLQTSRLNPMDTIHISKVPFDTPTKDSHHKTTYEDPLLKQFRSWFEVSIKDNPDLSHISINASESGALFEHWTHQPLSTTKDFPPTSPKPNYKKLTLSGVLDVLKPLKDMDIQNPVFQDYFYEDSPNKEKLFLKKLERVLCQ